MSSIVNFYKAFLSSQLNAGEASASILVDRITNAQGETVATSDFADFGRGILTINPNADGVSEFPENASFTTVGATGFTGAVRGLDKSGVTQTSLMRYHPVGTPVIISIGTHNLQDLKTYIDGLIAVAAIGTANVAAGTAGEILVAGNLVYLNTDGKWWKTDADTASTINGVELGIAQGAATANGAITNGVMLQGLDTHQSGLAAGTTYYASNTAGAISSSVGTNTKAIGVGRSSTSIYFDPKYANLPTASEKVNIAVTGIQSFTFGETITAGQALYLKTSDSKVYKTDSDASATTYNFIGFAYESGAVNDVKKVQVAGVVTGLSGLTAGTPYYIGATAGAIQTTAGTFGLQIGIALSTTTLLIQKIPGYYTFVYTASTTWTKKDGLKYIEVEVQAGGGGGGGNTTAPNTSGAGGGGGYSRKLIHANLLGATETVTVGAGGTAGAGSGGTGGTGGTSSFGTHATATGGGGGTISNGGDGGIGSSGDLNIKGQAGGGIMTGNGLCAGPGGSSFMGGGARPADVDASDRVGQDGGVYGGGGSGAHAGTGNDTLGGVGGAGVVIVREYYN